MDLYDESIGALLIGIFFNTFLYGLVTYQFAAYSRSKFNDGPVIKYMVLFLFILDTFHSASVLYMAWNYTVTNFDKPAALGALEWPYALTPLWNALAALITHVFLGFRIWRLTNSRLLCGTIIVLAIPSFILGMLCSIESCILKLVSKLPLITPIVTAWLVMQTTIDSFITITLIIVLSRLQTGFRRTDTVLNQLIRGAIQTGLFSGIFSLSGLITFIVLPNTNIHGMFAIPLGRIYTNTLMDTLLAREYLREELFGMDGTTSATHDSSRLSFHRFVSRRHDDSISRAAVGSKVRSGNGSLVT